ncbi:hypothetical protein [Chitinophaga sp.]|uniref:hypothetical protein n=1 Tax=Chitinophaga sp. TaxID=1869181 RepID=UPI0031DED414
MEQATIHATDNRPEQVSEFSPVLRGIAMFISYLLHPLFIPLLVTWLVVHALPEYFVTFKQISYRFPYDTLYFRVVAISIFFPALTVGLSRALNFIDSLHLRTQKDRIIPYISCTIYYFWAFYAFKKQGVAPPFFNVFFLGVFIAVIMAMVLNIRMKISMHTVGWGGVIGFVLIVMFSLQLNVSGVLLLAFFLSAIVATARLILNAHAPVEIYAGFLVGILAQLIAYVIVG